MKRISIERIVIDADVLGSQDVVWLRERVEEELQILLAEPQALDDNSMQSRTKVDGGELPAEPSHTLPLAIAEKVIGSLRGGT